MLLDGNTSLVSHSVMRPRSAVMTLGGLGDVSGFLVTFSATDFDPMSKRISTDRGIGLVLLCSKRNMHNKWLG